MTWEEEDEEREVFLRGSITATLDRHEGTAKRLDRLGFVERPQLFESCSRPWGVGGNSSKLQTGPTGRL